MTRLVRKNTAGCMVATLALVVGMLAETAQAQTTYTWTKTTGGALDWSTGANWSGGVAPDPISGDTVDFSTVNIAANTTLTLGADRTATIWKFGDVTTISQDWIVAAGNKIILAGTTPTINVVNRTATLNNVLDGTAGLTKSGTGDLTLSGANTYSGTTTINASGGSLILNNLSAIANSTSVSVASGTSLRFAAVGTYATAGTISIVGTGLSTLPDNSSGALWFVGGAYTLNAAISLTADATISSYGATVAQTLNNAIGGTGVLTIKSRGGATTHTAVWNLNAASDYSGNTIIMNRGGLKDVTVKLGIANALPTTTSLNLIGTSTDVNGFTTLDLNGYNQQLAGLTDTGSTRTAGTFGKRVINSSGTLATLTLNIASGTNTYGTTGTSITAGTIGGTTASGAAANNLALTKTGAGTLTLSGVNTYTGQTTVNGGTLTFAGSSSGTLGAIQVGGAATPVLNIQAGSYTQGANGFYVGAGAGPGIVNQTGGAVTWNSANLQLLISNGGLAGTYNLSGGSVTTVTAPSNDRGVMLGVNDNSSATFNLSGTGTLTVVGTSRLMIGRSDATQINTTNIFSQTGGTATISVMTMGGKSGQSATGSTATLTLTGGTFTATAFSLLSAANNDVSTINIGGTAIVTLPNLPTARGTGATATLNFDGGTLKNSATGTFITGLNNAFIKAGGATFDTALNSTTISQALHTHGSSLNGGLTKNGANTLTLSGANTYTGPTSVTGGTLKAGVASVANVSGAFGNNSAVTLNNTAGVTLDITGFDTQIGSLTGGGATGGNVTLGAATLTVGGDNTSPAAYAGVISGTGGLTKIGTGTQILSGNNSYSGPTTVNTGTLWANGSLTSAVTVNSGGTLGGTGTIAVASVVESGATLAPGNQIGTLTFSSGLTLETGAILALQLGSSSDSLRVSGGDFICPGGSGGVTVNVAPAAGSIQPGVYTLINWTGATPSSVEPADFTVNLPEGLNGVPSISGTTLNLTVSPSGSTFRFR